MSSVIVLDNGWESPSPSGVKLELEGLLHDANLGNTVSNIKVPLYKHATGQTCNKAFVYFTSERSARAALAALKTGVTLCGKPLKMMYGAKNNIFSKVKDDDEIREMLTVVIRNLARSVSLAEVESVFQQRFGEVLRSHRSTYTGSDTVQALIQFIDASAATAALRASEQRGIRFGSLIVTVEPYRSRVQQHPHQPHDDDGAAADDPYFAAEQPTPYDSLHEHLAPPQAQAVAAPAASEAYRYPHETYAHAQAHALPEPMPDAVPEPVPEGVEEHGGANAPPGHHTSGSAPLQEHVTLDSSQFCCPLTHEVFEDPVMAPDGQVYERSAIVEWLERQGTSPFTEQPMNTEQLRTVSVLSAALYALRLLQQENESLRENMHAAQAALNRPVMGLRNFI